MLKFKLGCYSRGVCAIHLAHLHWRGTADFFILAAAAGRLRPPASTSDSHSLLLASIFVHLCEMFVGVRPCVILFRYFFILVRSGRSKDEVGDTTSR